MNQSIKTVFFSVVLLTKSLYAINSGQFFILTLPNFSEEQEYSAWLEQTKPAGVMLRPIHVSNREKTKKLCTFLQKKAKHLGFYPLLICIDWEGGIVSRPNESGGFNAIPSPHNLANAGKASCFLAARLIAQQMAQVGINVDFAPSLDLFDTKNIVLATRCFAQDPKLVAEFGISFAKGLMSNGIIPVVKHYPGLMLGKSDTHFDKVQIDATQEEFDHNEKPFIAALQEKLPAIMVSHARYTQFGDIPASRSRKVIKHLKNINPDIIAITDDIAMQAYHSESDISSAALESISNGFDLLIYSAKPEEQIEIISKLNTLIKPEQTNDSVRKLKQKILNFTPSVTNLNEKEVANELAQRALAQDIKSVNLNNKNIVLVTVNLPKIRSAESWFIDSSGSVFAKLLSNSGFKFKEYTFNAMQKASISELKKHIDSDQFDSADIIFVQTFFYGDGIWNEVQKQWLEELKPYQTKIVILSLGHPYEKFILSQSQVIDLGSFHEPIITAAFNRLTTEPLLTGADKLAQNPERFLANKNIGLLCHKCSVVNEYASFDTFCSALLRKTLPAVAKGYGGHGRTSGLNSPAHGECAHSARIEPSPVGRRAELQNRSKNSFEPNGSKEFLPDFLYRWTKNSDSNSKLCTLFAPEHGIFGSNEAGASVKSENSSRWGVPIYSLHGATKCPSAESLQDLDLLIVDFQEVGMRCYTYLSTLALTLQAAKDNNVSVLVLERPNPIKFLGACGPKLNPKFESFLGKVNTQFVHGSTIGEIAKKLNKKIGADLTVLACGMAREQNTTQQRVKYNQRLEQDQIDAYFLNNYIPPSPNLPTIDSVYAYPMTVFIEGTNYSEGRGTMHPFEQIGAPWINGLVEAQKLANNLNKKKLPGIYFEPISFTPKIIPGMAENPKHKNKLCYGVFLHIYNRKILKPVLTAQTILNELFCAYPKQSEFLKFKNRYVIDLLAGDSVRHSVSNATAG
jgi:uncharacterized protein YbbC (DUF1343 family)/beta-glucosidase-like glycosyl hydrolase